MYGEMEEQNHWCLERSALDILVSTSELPAYDLKAGKALATL